MRGIIDFGSWHGLLTTVLGIVVFSLVAVGVRLFFMQAVQRRRERENRQVNERLKTLIAAYKILGGSFTGELAVDPAHRRQLRSGRHAAEAPHSDGGPVLPAADAGEPPGAERRRRIRDAVEAALSDVILLGTEQQVRLAAQAAADMAAGRAVETAQLVVSLRTFIREVLDLDPVPAGVTIPSQGPARAGGVAGGRNARADRSAGAAAGRGAAGGGAAGGGTPGGTAAWATGSSESGSASPPV